MSMKYLIGFNEAFSQESNEGAISTIISHISDNSDIDFYEYKEIWYVQKKNLFVIGELFLSISTKKAIRFNWTDVGIKTRIHSIDVWDNFKFNSDPTFTMEVEKKSIKGFLPQLLESIKDSKSEFDFKTKSESERAETESENITQIEDEDLKSKILELTDFPKGKSIDILSIPMHINKDYNRLDFLLNRISLDTDDIKKMEATEYLSKLSNKYPDKFTLNIKNIINAVNLRSVNDNEVEIDDKKELSWKLLIKKYLINSK